MVLKCPRVLAMFFLVVPLLVTVAADGSMMRIAFNLPSAVLAP